MIPLRLRDGNFAHKFVCYYYYLENHLERGLTGDSHDGGDQEEVEEVEEDDEPNVRVLESMLGRVGRLQKGGLVRGEGRS